ncbi:hypothetical protein BJV78DRAFT_194485 [Lactifluus subvellereus]|nr:hypothetical protein BJV78DRAFT_194485 [Lactifluus subvellereus]
MVNWNDPSVLYKDYFALIKLDHAIAGIYMCAHSPTQESEHRCELTTSVGRLFTAGFELDVLRGKRPYRWTIWLYLGTRYCGLIVFILTIIGEDGGKASCRPYTDAISVLGFASWAFASLIIVLRVIAVWNPKRIVSFLSVCLWLACVVTDIYSMTIVKVLYNPDQDSCTVLGFHKSSTGIWYLLYQQCIIWIALACIAEVPVVVFLILNLNEAWNAMFFHAAVAILSIGAARLYRSLCQHGSLTEYMTSELPPSSPGRPISNAQYRAGNIHGSIHCAATSRSNNTVSTSEAPVFIPKDPVQLVFAPGASNPRLVHEKSDDEVGYDLETA